MLVYFATRQIYVDNGVTRLVRVYTCPIEVKITKVRVCTGPIEVKITKDVRLRSDAPNQRSLRLGYSLQSAHFVKLHIPLPS